MNLYLRVSIYVAGEELPAVSRVSRHCHFYFRSVAASATENRFAGSGSLAFREEGGNQRGAVRHRLPSMSLFPALLRTPVLPIIPRLIAGETDFSRHVDSAGATNELSRDWYCEGMYVIAIVGGREREIPRFPIRARWLQWVAVVMTANRRFQFRDVDRMNRGATVI